MKKTSPQQFITFALLLAATASLRAQSYTAIDLGVLDGGNYSAALGINNAGQVVGESYSTSGSQAFLYSGGAIIGLGRLPETSFAIALAINDTGQIVGYSGSRAFIYATGSMTGIETPNGHGSGAYDINNSGQVVGWMSSGSGGAFLYTSGSANDLEGNTSYAFGINDGGQIVGRFLSPDGTRAFSYSEGVMTSLGTLPGANLSEAYDINNKGQIVGKAGGFPGQWNTHAFLYSDGNMIDLGVLGDVSIATGINESGLIVGYSPVSGGGGFLYSDGVMKNINTLIQPGSGISNVTISETGTPTYGKPINDWGQIAALGKNTDGNTRAVLLNPVDPLSSTSDDGTSRNTKFVGGMDYNTFTTITNPDGLGTGVYLLDGTAGSNGAGGDYGFNRDVTVSFTGADNTGLASDIVSLTGTFGDVIVLSLTYDNSLFGDNVALGWFDGDEWVLAIDGNTGTPGDLAGFYGKSYADFLADEGAGVFDSITMLGAYGSANGGAWAVINHNSDFAAIQAVPEPSACALLALGASALFFSRTRRKIQATARPEH